MDQKQLRWFKYAIEERWRKDRSVSDNITDAEDLLDELICRVIANACNNQRISMQGDNNE